MPGCKEIQDLSERTLKAIDALDALEALEALNDCMFSWLLQPLKHLMLLTPSSESE
jgi:hypothetical protein